MYPSWREGHGSLEEQSSQTGLHTDILPLHHEQLQPTEHEICFRESHVNLCLHRRVDEIRKYKVQMREIQVKSCLALYMQDKCIKCKQSE